MAVLFLGYAFAQTDLSVNSCADEPQLISGPSVFSATIQFVNSTDQTVRVYWRNFNGQPDIAGLPAGVFRGAFTLVFSDGSIRTVGITLVLTARSASPTGERAASGCTPMRLLPILTSLGVDFNVPASWPIPIETAWRTIAAMLWYRERS